MRRATPCFVAALLLGAVSTANAQFLNPGFETGNLNDWTLSLTANGATAVQVVELFDIDGPGPLTDSLAAKFSVGRASTTGDPNGGILLTQVLNLTAGVKYAIDYDWAAIRILPGGTNSEGGVFEIIVDGVQLAIQNAGSTSPTLPHYGHLSAEFTPAVSGPYTVGARITRPFTIPTPTDPTLFQYVDNFSIVPEPGTFALLGLVAVAALRRR